MKPVIEYVLIIFAVLLLLFFSFKIRRLDQVLKTEVFNAETFATEFWKNDIPLCVENAPKLEELLPILSEDPEEAFTRYSHKLGISNTCYFFIKGSGTITSVDEENIFIGLADGQSIMVAVDFIFGNAVRDGSGRVNIDDFLNMTDFNNVSVELNRLVKKNITQELKESVVPGSHISFAGAFEMNEQNPDLSGIRIIPVSATVNDL